MPTGIKIKGDLSVIENPNFNKIAGSMASSGEGVYEFTKDIKQAVFAYLFNVCNEQNTDTEVYFWLVKIDS